LVAQKHSSITKVSRKRKFLMRLLRIPLWILCLLGLLSQDLFAAPSEAFVPRFEPHACPVAFLAQYKVDCGYVTVPEEHANPYGTRIQLAVAVFHTTSPDPLPDPVIALVGGPGQNALQLAQNGLSPFWETALERRDFILFDQRGMGYSQPTLACPEVDAIKLRSHFDAGSINDPLELDAAHRCYDRLVRQGINISAFNTVESAADVRAVIAALGYGDYNITGGSYGSALGFAVMRDYPEHIRSITLTAISPPQADLMASFSTNVQRNLQLIVEACRSDQACAAVYPDIERTLSELVRRLNALPVRFQVNHPVTGYPMTLSMNGDDLVAALMLVMYNPGAIPKIPAFIRMVSSGRNTVLWSVAREYLSNSLSRTDGAFYAMRCMDDVMTAARADWEAAVAGLDPAMQTYWRGMMDWWYSLCGIGWGAKQLDPIENTPVNSTIPTLLQSGQFDPVTPAAWGDLALETLPNGYHFVFPGSAHNTAPTPCAVAVFAQFLDDPTSEPDGSCIGEMPGLSFVIP
jgi:pimeloyl-ACP methyl ester carboxylesterase